MKRLLMAASLVAMVTGVAAADPTVPKVHSTKPVIPKVHFLTYKVAPADEYFGRLKMSILGIRNTIKDLGLKVDADPTQGANLVSSCMLTEDALHDWEQKYPQDTWIPGSLFALERLYAKVDSDAARAKARATMVWLVHDFPQHKLAKEGKHELALNQVGVKPVATPAPATPVVGDAPPPAPVETPDH